MYTTYIVLHKKCGTLLLSISSLIIHQFSKFFHWHTLRTISNNSIFYVSHHTVNMSLYYLVKCKCQKTNDNVRHLGKFKKKTLDKHYGEWSV